MYYVGLFSAFLYHSLYLSSWACHIKVQHSYRDLLEISLPQPCISASLEPCFLFWIFHWGAHIKKQKKSLGCLRCSSSQWDYNGWCRTLNMVLSLRVFHFGCIYIFLFAFPLHLSVNWRLILNQNGSLISYLPFHLIIGVELIVSAICAYVDQMIEWFVSS